MELSVLHPLDPIGGYIAATQEFDHDDSDRRQAAAFADSTSPAFMPGAFEVAAATVHAEPRIRESFRTGEGLPWGEQHTCLFGGTDSFFKASYIGNLIHNWIPVLDGPALGAQAGEARLSDFVRSAGFEQVRQATDTRFNLVIEVTN